ncbi:hypothetical protein [Haloarchaeobius sp. DYHT-AS-18]|uniref:hypothetical protein n=1 Tax=Haloarchaeobius sp. DYHT-AS-18 TaxID=3446117 RepID=UPI003EB80CE3
MLLATLLSALCVPLQSLPPELAEMVNEVRGTLNPTTAAMYGGGGLLSVASVRWLVKRRAGGSLKNAAGGTNVSTSGGGGGGGQAAVTTTSSGTSKHNVAFTLPSFIPLSKGVRSVTHNEIHALELGVVVGLVGTWLYAHGQTEVVTTIVVAFVMGSLGYKRYSSKAFKTIRYEPWYALLALTGGGALGFAVFLMEPSLVAGVLSMA